MSKKVRSSIRKQLYSEKRADEYKQLCEKILSDKRLSIRIDDADMVYVQYINGEEFLLQITNPKTTWFEIWVKLREI